ncbi:hypothetical protein ACFX1X_015896 [Malus domestica]
MACLKVPGSSNSDKLKSGLAKYTKSDEIVDFLTLFDFLKSSGAASTAKTGEFSRWLLPLSVLPPRVLPDFLHVVHHSTTPQFQCHTPVGGYCHLELPPPRNLHDHHFVAHHATTH